MSDVAETSLLTRLKSTGANQANPVHFHYLTSLEQRLRAKGLQGSAHWRKLEQAVAEFQARARENTTQLLAEPHPPSPLIELTHLLNQAHGSTPAQAPRSAIEQFVFGTTEEFDHPQTVPNHPQPLKSMTRATANQGEQALQYRIQHAIEAIPEDAGPMNAHRLVSRAIAEMQCLSPEYLNRMAKYTDTLMTLEKLGRKI